MGKQNKYKYGICDNCKDKVEHDKLHLYPKTGVIQLLLCEDCLTIYELSYISKK